LVRVSQRGSATHASYTGNHDAAAAERSLRIAADLPVRWLQEHPRTGADPDVCVFEPAPPDFDDLKSFKLWEPGRVPPRLAIEVVSTSFPHKDYGRIQERYAAMGVEELVVFDPLLCGPRSLGGPVALQLWRRDATQAFERVDFGSEPVHSSVLDAWLIANDRDLDISNDRQGKQRWLTAEERLLIAQAEAERAQAEAERERQARQDIEKRLREPEARLPR
jgi:Putative restriction endonuclease